MHTQRRVNFTCINGVKSLDNQQDAEQRVLEATQKAGIVPGVVIAHPSPEELTRLLKEGFLLVLYGTDMGFLAQACRETVQHLRLALSEMVGN